MSLYKGNLGLALNVQKIRYSRPLLKFIVLKVVKVLNFEGSQSHRISFLSSLWHGCKIKSSLRSGMPGLSISLQQHFCLLMGGPIVIRHIPILVDLSFFK